MEGEKAYIVVDVKGDPEVMETEHGSAYADMYGLALTRDLAIRRYIEGGEAHIARLQRQVLSIQEKIKKARVL